MERHQPLTLPASEAVFGICFIFGFVLFALGIKYRIGSLAFLPYLFQGRLSLGSRNPDDSPYRQYHYAVCPGLRRVAHIQTEPVQPGGGFVFSGRHSKENFRNL